MSVIAHERWTELRLVRPPRNVLDRDLLETLVAALDRLAARPDPPLLLLAAQGKHFSTGYAIGEIPEEVFHRDAAVRAGHPFEQALARLVHYPAPVVAAVQGDAWGGAVELLACADLRVASDQVRLGVPPVRLGLVYSHTGLRRLLRGFGSSLTRELLFTGEAISAERAQQVGFFHRVVGAEELATAAMQMLEAVARGGPQALRGTRRILALLEDAESLPHAALEEIAALRHASWAGEEFRRAREAFLAGKPSPFGGI
ncbi:MAG: enoyl-CoA hydratase-related protein [Candidatus Krumholzibacteriia bacterium]